MKCFVTGAAGFIGSNLVDRLLADGNGVIAWDNISTGYASFLISASKHAGFELCQADILSTALMIEAMAGSDIVFHLAANADVRHGVENYGYDLQQNTIGTFSVLEAMKAAGVKNIVFTSSASVYGDLPGIYPTPENVLFPVQNSFYGASKLAGEALIQAFCESFGFQAHIFRLVSVLGERYSHGHVFDFYKQLKKHPDHLDILGNGQQGKSYLYVQDVIDGMLIGLEKASDKVNIFNLANAGYVTVAQSADCIAAHMDLPSPKMNFLGEGPRGWIGDSPLINPDSSKIEALGWKRKFSISQAIERTVHFLKENEWILNTR